MKTFQRPQGHKCEVSSTVYECLSFGTGELDFNGFWEHGCYECAREHERQFPGDICWPHSHKTLRQWRRQRIIRTIKKILFGGKDIRWILCFRPIKFMFIKNWYGKRWKEPGPSCDGGWYYLFDRGSLTIGVWSKYKL